MGKKHDKIPHDGSDFTPTEMATFLTSKLALENSARWTEINKRAQRLNANATLDVSEIRIQAMLKIFIDEGVVSEEMLAKIGYQHQKMIETSIGNMETQLDEAEKQIAAASAFAVPAGTRPGRNSAGSIILPTGEVHEVPRAPEVPAQEKSGAEEGVA